MVLSKKSVLKLKPYLNGKNSRAIFQNRPWILKLDSNEASFPPSPSVLEAIKDSLKIFSLNWYPDLKAEELVEKLSAYTQCPAPFIQVFNGSDHSLETICRTFLESGDEALITMPSYDHFRVYVEACDAAIVPLWGEFPKPASMDEVIGAVTSKTKLIYIVHPSTSETYNLKDIERLLESAPETLVIVDEAYYEFNDITAVSLLLAHPNLVISRSFSKAFALAGLRVGYLLSHPCHLESINKVRLGKINTLSQSAACAALDDVAYMKQYVFEVNTAKKWLKEKLEERGLYCLDPKANYLWVAVEKPKEIADFLEKSDILIRANVPQKGYLRITIGHQLLMERFWKVFKNISAASLGSEKVQSKRPRRDSLISK